MQELHGIIEQAGAMFSDLAVLQKKYLDGLKAGQQPDHDQDSEEIVQGLQAGEAVLSRCGLKPDTGVCRELQQDICRLIAKHRTGKEELVARAGALLDGNRHVYEAFLQDHRLPITGEAAPEEREMLAFIVAQTLRPFLQDLAIQYRAVIDQEQWLRDYCPVCGDKATLAYLRSEDGKRMLICPACGEEWLYKYLSCSWCGNEDHQDISFFEVEVIPAYEVYLCEKCHGYLKTYNEKKASEHGDRQRDWPLEDVRTLVLDMLAMQRGYANPGQQVLM